MIIVCGTAVTGKLIEPDCVLEISRNAATFKQKHGL